MSLAVVIHLRNAALDILETTLERRSDQDSAVLSLIRSRLRRAHEEAIDEALGASEDERLAAFNHVSAWAHMRFLPTDWALSNGDREALIAEARLVRPRGIDA